MIKYAFKNKLGKHIFPMIQNIETLLKQIPINLAREIYKVIHDGLDSMKKRFFQNRNSSFKNQTNYQKKN